MKTCSRCKTGKPVVEFTKYNKSIDGFSYECRSCKKERAAKWYLDNRERSAKNRKARYEKNKEIENSRSKRWAEKNIISIRVRHKLYRKNHKEQFRIYEARHVKELSDKYVKQRITRATGLPVNEISSKLVEAKRLHLQIIRKLKELRA